jgi:uncharacterized membrane protein YpjA
LWFVFILFVNNFVMGLFELLFENKKFLLLLAIINFVAAIYSINYYLPQLQRTNFLFWFFVVDCIVYSIFFGILLLFKIKEKFFPLFGFIVIVGCLKYALWTLFALFLSGNIFSAFLITISHVLLLLQVIVFYKYFKFKIKHIFIVILWFLLNDFFDYVLFLHPNFDTVFFVEIATFSIITSIFLTLFVSIFFSKK